MQFQRKSEEAARGQIRAQYVQENLIKSILKKLSAYDIMPLGKKI